MPTPFARSAEREAAFGIDARVADGQAGASRRVAAPDRGRPRGRPWQAEIVIAGVGVDIVDVARLGDVLERTPELAERLFTGAERTAANSRKEPLRLLAGSFAAKEALAKALGAPAGLTWTDAEVLRNERGRPFLRVEGTVAAEASRQGIGEWHLSLSHDGGLCVAIVVAEYQGSGR